MLSIHVGLSFDSLAQIATNIPISSYISGLTINPTYSSTAQTNVALRCNVVGLQVGDTATYQWQAGGIDIVGANEEVFTPIIGTNVADLDNLRCQISVNGQLAIVSQTYTVRHAPPIFTIQPTITGLPQIGQTLTLVEGSVENATQDIATLTLDGVDKTPALAGLNWDTSGESVYGTSGLVEYVVVGSNSGGTVVSDIVTTTLIDVPAPFSAVGWDVSEGALESIDVTLNTLPDDGGDTLTEIEYRTQNGPWMSSGGITAFSIAGPFIGNIAVELRALNNVGSGATSDIKTIEFSVASNSTLTLNALQLNGGTNGTAPSLDIDVTYDGPENLSFYGVTSTATVAPTQAEIAAGTGAATLESFEGGISAGAITLPNALNSASETARYIYGFVAEDGGAFQQSDVISFGNNTLLNIKATPPSIGTTDPVSGSSDHPINRNLTISFSDNIHLAVGNITLRENDGVWADVETFDVSNDVGANGGQVSAMGATLTINPTNNLIPGRLYALRIAPTALIGDWGAAFAGITDDTTFQFTATSTVSAFAFEDSFTRSDQVLTASADWNLATGSAEMMDIQNNALRLHFDTTFVGSAVVNGSFANDQAAEMDVSDITGTTVVNIAGPAVRYTDDNNHYGFTIEPVGQIIQFLDGNFGNWAPQITFADANALQAGLMNPPFTMRIAAQDTTVTASINGVVVASANSSTQVSGSAAILIPYTEGAVDINVTGFRIEDL